MYKIYKKPNMYLSQISPSNNSISTNNERNDYIGHSHYNLKHNTENVGNNILYKKLNNLGKFYETNYIKDINNNSNDNNIFRKKNAIHLNTIECKFNHNTYKNPRHIYSKKSPPLLRQGNLFNNIFGQSILSNTLSNIKDINQNKKIYTKNNNSNFNSTYKLFNSQIINIRNNIYNTDNKTYKNEFMNNTAFANNIFQTINLRKARPKNDINKKVKNNCCFLKKYYNYNSKITTKKLYLYNKSFIKIEKVMKKYIMPLSYITKCNINIYKIPKLNCSYYSKKYMLNNNKKNKKNSNKEIENIIKVNDYIKKKVFTINKNKGKIAIKKNIKENEFNNKKKTNNNNMIRIR
jgi:hypothetical protein